MTTDVRRLHEKRLKESPTYRAEYESLEDEFTLASALIKARAKAGLSQEEVAARMGTSQAAVARLEGGKGNPSKRTLERYAEAVGSRLRIEL
jgi:ribosome-binding protein aMBF1 (putative translation factor)